MYYFIHILFTLLLLLVWIYFYYIVLLNQFISLFISDVFVHIQLLYYLLYLFCMYFIILHNTIYYYRQLTLTCNLFNTLYQYMDNTSNLLSISINYTFIPSIYSINQNLPTNTPKITLISITITNNLSQSIQCTHFICVCLQHLYLLQTLYQLYFVGAIMMPLILLCLLCLDQNLYVFIWKFVIYWSYFLLYKFVQHLFVLWEFVLLFKI